jgi:putative two-component system response regulator
MRAEISLPTRSIPPRRGRAAAGRNRWRCGETSRRHTHWHGLARPAAKTARRVLVIDDERAIRAVCRVNLTASGMDVLEAEDGASGLDVARREQPDLILLDVMMPGVDGWDVARRLAGDPATRQIPVVFLTARADAADKRRAQYLGSVGYVVKPFDPVQLAGMIEDVLGRIERGERVDLEREITEGLEEKK